MTIKIILKILLLFLLTAGCGQKKAETFKALPFPQVTPPEMINDPQEVSEYLALHYWDRLIDKYDDYPCDSLLVNGVSKEDIEQNFANWTYFLSMLPVQSSDKAIATLYDKASASEKKDTSSNVFETFTELTYKYFYDPNSPLRNEDHYYPYVKRLSQREDLSPEMKGKYEHYARMCSMNRAGTVAADFRFSDRRGNIRTLHGINAPYTLVFFSNPGCTACKTIIDVLNNNQRISSMINDGTLAVLNMYIDEDLEEWMSYMPIYPESWYNAFDPDFILRDNSIYSVRAIPSLYLLDEEKRVILKDVPEQKVFDYLSRL